MTLTAEYVREILSYDPETGVLTWKQRADQGKAWNSRWAGKEAGTDTNGYRYLIINCRHYAAHRVIWLMVTGEWPQEHLDHADLDRSNNRWINLREANRAENAANRRAHKDGLTAIKGVTWHAQRGKFYARINVNKRQISLGLHNTAEGAGRAYAAAAVKYNGEFART